MADIDFASARPRRYWAIDSEAARGVPASIARRSWTPLAKCVATNCASGLPIRSTCPTRIRLESPDVNTANLTLDDPALMTRIKGGVGEFEVGFDGRVIFKKKVAIQCGFTVRLPQESG